MLTDRTRLRLAQDVSYQSLGPGEQTVLLSLSSGYLYTCNETTAAFLDGLDGQRGFGQVVEELFEQFDVPREQLHADLADLVDELMAEGLIVEAGQAGD
jgi:hypothetical protein